MHRLQQKYISVIMYMLKQTAGNCVHTHQPSECTIGADLMERQAKRAKDGASWNSSVMNTAST